VFEDLKDSLRLSTSPEGGVFNFEVGPVAEHVKAVFLSVKALEVIGKTYDEESKVRQRIGAGWSERANVVAQATGVEIIADVASDELTGTSSGDQLAGLKAPVDTASAILQQVEELGQNIVTADTTTDTGPKAEVVIDKSNVIDFTAAQRKKAQEIAARNAVDKAYSTNQNVA